MLAYKDIPSHDPEQTQSGRKVTMVVTPGKVPVSNMGKSSRFDNHVILEEESQDESDEDSGRETKAPIIIKKLGRNSRCEKRGNNIQGERIGPTDNPR
jgi:hypothetical protein